MTEVALGGPSSGPIAGSPMASEPKQEDTVEPPRACAPLLDERGRNDPLDEPPSG